MSEQQQHGEPAGEAFNVACETCGVPGKIRRLSHTREMGATRQGEATGRYWFQGKSRRWYCPSCDAPHDEIVGTAPNAREAEVLAKSATEAFRRLDGLAGEVRQQGEDLAARLHVLERQLVDVTEEQDAHNRMLRSLTQRVGAVEQDSRYFGSPPPRPLVDVPPPETAGPAALLSLLATQGGATPPAGITAATLAALQRRHVRALSILERCLPAVLHLAGHQDGQSVGAVSARRLAFDIQAVLDQQHEAARGYVPPVSAGEEENPHGSALHDQPEGP